MLHKVVLYCTVLFYYFAQRRITAWINREQVARHKIEFWKRLEQSLASIITILRDRMKEKK